MYDFRLALANKIPQIGILRRYLKACLSHILPAGKSYSQYGEDIHIRKLIDTIQIDKQRDIYVDIGANHPMDLSNTIFFTEKVTGV
jgi:hypothetical protein